MKRSLLRLSFPFREPYTTSAGVVTERELLLLRIESADGHVGYGEAAPFEPYDGIPLERAIATLTRRSRGRRPPQARAAVEMARLDLDARREGRPVGEPGAEAIPVNRTLVAGPPEEVSAATPDPPQPASNPATTTSSGTARSRELNTALLPDESIGSAS